MYFLMKETIKYDCGRRPFVSLFQILSIEKTKKEVLKIFTTHPFGTKNPGRICQSQRFQINCFLLIPPNNEIFYTTSNSWQIRSFY